MAISLKKKKVFFKTKSAPGGHSGYRKCLKSHGHLLEFNKEAPVLCSALATYSSGADVSIIWPIFRDIQ